MPIVETFDQTLTKSERRVISETDTPMKIQAFLDGLPSGIEKNYRCPIRVLRERRTHCLDGALGISL